MNIAIVNTTNKHRNDVNTNVYLHVAESVYDHNVGVSYSLT